MHAMSLRRAGLAVRILAVTTVVLLGLATGEAQAEPSQGFQDAAGGIRYREIEAGAGPVAGPGMVATIHLRTWLDDNGERSTEVINTRSLGRQVSFVIGTDKVMPAWNAGVNGMREGGKRLLLVPPGMAYGDKGVEGLVPAGSPLILEIELVGLSESAQLP